MSYTGYSYTGTQQQGAAGTHAGQGRGQPAQPSGSAQAYYLPVTATGGNPGRVNSTHPQMRPQPPNRSPVAQPADSFYRNQDPTPQPNRDFTSEAYPSNETASLLTSAGPSSSTSTCKLPPCQKLAIFDHHINEQREFCKEHIEYALQVGFASPCKWCRKMPARLNSKFKFCSEACSRAYATSPATNDYPQVPQPAAQPAVQQSIASTSQPEPSRPSKRRRDGGGESSTTATGKPESNLRPDDNLGQTCQECRRFMTENRRYCSEACKEASRQRHSTPRR